jgi:hypothetical protein
MPRRRSSSNLNSIPDHNNPASSKASENRTWVETYAPRPRDNFDEDLPEISIHDDGSYGILGVQPNGPNTLRTSTTSHSVLRSQTRPRLPNLATRPASAGPSNSVRNYQPQVQRKIHRLYHNHLVMSKFCPKTLVRTCRRNNPDFPIRLKLHFKELQEAALQSGQQQTTYQLCVCGFKRYAIPLYLIVISDNPFSPRMFSWISRTKKCVRL